MKQVTIIGQQFPVPEDTDAADMPTWCDQYTAALKNAFAATPSSAFPVPTAANNAQYLTVAAGVPKWAAIGDFVKKSGDTMTGQLNVPAINLTSGSFYSASIFHIASVAGGGLQVVRHASADANPSSSMTRADVPASSREFKNNIEPFSDATVFDKIQPVSFDYKPDTDWANDHDKATRHVGFIAEDVADAGVAVSVVDDTIIGLRDSELIAVLWAKVAELESRLAAVEGNTP